MKTNRTRDLSLGAGIGALVAYYADSQHGKRRRALMRDQLSHIGRSGAAAFRRGGRDISHRTLGTFAKAKSAVRPDAKDITDDVIEDRIRSKMGRVVSHPHSVDVVAKDGNVILHGYVLAHELDALRACIAEVPGVKTIREELEVHKQSDRIPSLQGGRPRKPGRIDVMQSNWAPATRMIMGGLGSGLGIYGIFRRDFLGGGFGALGILALVRAVTNIETKRLLGFGGRQAIRFHKTLHIAAPIEEVFDFWSDFENFPKFISEVKDVRAFSDVRSRWTIRGPMGSPVSWDAETTKFIRNELIAWRSAPAEVVRHAGQVKFFPSEKQGTKIELDFTYNPPAGWLGHEIARIFGGDAKGRIESSLIQMKQLLEQEYQQQIESRSAAMI